MTLKMQGKCVLFSAPSGAGKTTIVRALLEEVPALSFSVSACSRDPRPNEINGKDYHFLGVEGFQRAILNEELVEWEEVYTNNYYGTLKTELERIWAGGKTVIFDVDVVGGLNLKKMFGDKALAIFVQPPSVDELEKRLRNRSTETEDKINQRMSKARAELAKATDFDIVLVNDNLQQAIVTAKGIIEHFIAS